MPNQNKVDRAVAAAGGGPEGFKALASLLGVSKQAIYGFRRRGYFPIQRAHVVASRYAIPLEDLVEAPIA